jgi:hypothetical protein
LVVVTPDNRFVLVKYAGEISANPFVADEGGRTRRLEHFHRMPVLRPKSKSAPVNVTSVNITKLPPGEAYGARDLQRWHKGNEKRTEPRSGHLVGLLHDLGKYTQEFQDYIAGTGQSRWSKGLFLTVAGMSSFERIGGGASRRRCVFEFARRLQPAGIARAHTHFI